MQLINSRYPRDWLRLAEADLRRVEKLLNIGACDLAGFCLRQLVEKFMKAFPLFSGWKLRRIHDLEALLDDAAKYDESLARFREPCMKISAFYFLGRHPITAPSGISEQDIRESLNEIMPLINRLREALR